MVVMKLIRRLGTAFRRIGNEFLPATRPCSQSGLLPLVVTNEGKEYL
jgi:hypothetical protein